MLALAASGLNGQSFAFVGYLPADAAGRAQRIRELEALVHKSGQTQIFIETPLPQRGTAAGPAADAQGHDATGGLLRHDAGAAEGGQRAGSRLETARDRTAAGPAGGVPDRQVRLAQ